LPQKPPPHDLNLMQLLLYSQTVAGTDQQQQQQLQ